MSYSQLSSLAIIIAAISTVRAEDLCYRISYNCDSNVENCENSLLVQPLDKINAGHELLTSAQCGSTYSVNQPIPATGKWSNNGATSSSSSSCYNVDGGGLMYAYNHPKHSSSNTGFESVEKAQFLFLVDEADSLYFLIGLDKPNNADGGKFALQIESVAGSLAGTTVSLYDDTRGNTFPSSSWNSCFNYGQDRFAWDSVNGRGSMRWYWATCCTDGAVISGLPSGSGVEGNIEFTIKMLQPTSYHYHSREPDGLDSFMFPSWDTHNNEFQHPITEVTWADISNGIRVSISNCNSYCSQYDTVGCSRCATDPQCTWCATGGGSCKETSSVNTTCPAEFRKDGCDCNVCEPLTDCSACVNSDESCIWTGSNCKSERADGKACDGNVGTDGDCICDSTYVANSNYALVNSIYGSYNATFDVRCNTGYSDNEAQAVCNGFQFTNLPVCEPGACISMNVENSNYASAQLTGYTGQSYNVICSEGYEGGGTTTCESNGQFSSVTCTKIHCTDVTIAHATPSPVTGESFTTYDVTCDEGYHVNGQSQNDRVQSATCQSTGQFTVLQNCVANTCGSFSHANSDQSSPVSGLTTGDQLSVTCNTGYTSDGTVTIQTATCQTNGMFNTLNSCNANTCGSFSHANSDQSSPISGLTTGDQLSVSCNTGYTSDGTVTAPQTAICQADGTFNTLNSCNANTCTSQAVLNAVGTPFTGHTTAEVITVVCEDGYYGGGDMTCSTLGSFESVPTCNQILCTPPIVLYGTYHDSSWNDVADGTTLNLLNVNCSEGFSKSNVSISCGCSANGQPCDSLTTVCYSNGCSPPSVNNGHYNILEWGDPKSNGQELNSSRIICDAGYRRTAELNFVCGCLEDGASCEAITNACEEKMCPELNVNSGALTATCTEVGATSGTTCIFACSAGYSMSGTNPVPCELSGSWGTPYPSCTENMCEEIFVSRSGSTAGANCSEAAAIDNPVCEFSCSAGYTLIGVENVPCYLDGNWGTYPTCEAQSCNAIEIENSDFSNSIVGNTDDIHVVTCQNGYTENDQSRIQTLKCDGNTMTFRRVLTDGSLANVLQCVANDCTPTFHLNSDKSVAGSIAGTTGEIVTVTCNPGYTNDGNTITMNTTCDGQSFSALDTCVPNTCISTSVAYSVDFFENNSINGSVGDSFDVVCLQGYSGGGTTTCDTNGMFNVLTCEPNPCNPGFVEYSSNYGEVDSINGTTGDVFNIECADFFVGGGQVTCQPDGNLSTLPSCDGIPLCLSEKGEDWAAFNKDKDSNGADCTFASHSDSACVGEAILDDSLGWVAIYSDGGRYNASWSKRGDGLSGADGDKNLGNQVAHMTGVDAGIDIFVCQEGGVCCDGACFYDHDVSRCNSDQTYEACCTAEVTTEPPPTAPPTTTTTATPTTTTTTAATPTTTTTASPTTTTTTASPTTTTTTAATPTTTTTEAATTTPSPSPSPTQPENSEFDFNIELNGLNQSFVEQNEAQVGNSVSEAVCIRIKTLSGASDDTVSCTYVSMSLQQRRRLAVEGTTWTVIVKVTSTDASVTSTISSDNGAVLETGLNDVIETRLSTNGISGAVQGTDLEVTSVELSSGSNNDDTASSSDDNNMIMIAAAGAGGLVVLLVVGFIAYRRFKRSRETFNIMGTLDASSSSFATQSTDGMTMDDKQESLFVMGGQSKPIHEL